MTTELRKRARAKLVDIVRDQILVLNRDHGHAITPAQADERARNIVMGMNEIFDIACDEVGDDIVAGLVGVIAMGRDAGLLLAAHLRELPERTKLYTAMLLENHTQCVLDPDDEHALEVARAVIAGAPAPPLRVDAATLTTLINKPARLVDNPCPNCRQTLGATERCGVCAGYRVEKKRAARLAQREEKP